MSAAVATTSAPNEVNASGPEVCHYVCCDENTAFCGADVTHSTWLTPDEEAQSPVCVVCDDLDESSCCGQLGDDQA